MRLTLGKKLGAGFGVILALMVFSSLMTYFKSSDIQETQAHTMSLRVPTITTLTELQRDLNQTQSKGRQAILAAADPARRDAAQQLFNSAWNDIGKDVARLDELAEHWSLQINRDRLAETKDQLSVLRGAQETAMKDAIADNSDAIVKAGNEFADKATPATEAIKKALGDIVDSNAKLLGGETERMNEQNQAMNLTMAITTFAALAIGIFVAIFLGRSISGTTQSVLAEAEAIAAGDLTRNDLSVRSQDELGDLTTAINKMRASLRELIQSIAGTAEHVASASEEISSTATQISKAPKLRTTRPRRSPPPCRKCPPPCCRSPKTPARPPTLPARPPRPPARAGISWKTL